LDLFIKQNERETLLLLRIDGDNIDMPDNQYATVSSDAKVRSIKAKSIGYFIPFMAT